MKFLNPSLGVALLSGLVSGHVAVAQIIPDTTLPINSSVAPGCTQCVIDGGTVQGDNLFHSFREFSVPTGGAAWFNNAPHIQNILTRVTGPSVSSIDGLLRANGTANLFFLNPNGILFGPNARLAIGGSFLATTATHFQFSDGSEFSATNPQAPPLLTVNVPVGLQVGASRPGATIAQAGQLSTGQNLTLVGDRLDIAGQLTAGNHLTLQAQDTVRLRDSASAPLIAQAGQTLTIQGDRAVDIFALNHPGSGLWAGQDIVLRSGGAIAGDAHYTAGGSFRIEQLDGSLGAWSSPNDPIIRATGDVSFDSYTGASLHIFAGGSVTANSITITGPDATNGLAETVTLSDGTPLSIDGRQRPTLDIRAGTLALSGPLGLTGTPSPTVLTTAPAPTTTNIAVNTIRVVPANGLVYLTNNYQPNPGLPGSITVGAINTAQAAAGDGGAVVIDSRDRLTVNGRINTIAAQAKGGQVTLLANGDLAVNTPTSAAPPTFGAAIFTAGQTGGAITIKGKQTVAITGTGDRSLFPINNASLSTVAGLKGEDITIAGRVVSLSRSGTLSSTANSSAASGNIFVTATDAIVLDSSEISTTVFPNARGQGGAVTITAPTLTLQNRGQLLTVTRGIGAAGLLTVNADTITLDNNSLIGSIVLAGASGNAGTVTVNTRSLTASNFSNLFSSTSGAGDAGSLSINASEAVVLDKASRTFTSIEAGATGKSGNTAINTRLLALTDGSQIRTTTVGPQNAGAVTIQADTVVVDGVGRATEQPSGISSAVLTGGTGAGGDITIAARTVAFTNGGAISANTNSTNRDPILGRAGNVTIRASESVLFDGIGPLGFNSGVRAETFLGSGQGGAIAIYTPSLQVTNGAQLRSNTNGPGHAGNLSLFVQDSILLAGPNTGLFASTAPSSTGNGGKIFIDPKTVVVRDGARISVDSQGSGLGGDIQLEATRLTLDNQGLISADTASTNGGNITLQLGELLVLRRGSRISTNAGTAQAGGDGGNILVNVPAGFVVGVRSENSDITANAFTGQGGRVQINAQGIFGLQFQPQLTAESDITASSTFGLSGVVEINTPEIDPSKTLAGLPVAPVDLSSLVAQSCSASSARTAQQNSEFVFTGQGGLPAGPDTDKGVIIWQALTSLTDLVDSRNSATGPALPNRAQAASEALATPKDTLIEAQGLQIMANGDVVLVATATSERGGYRLAQPQCASLPRR